MTLQQLSSDKKGQGSNETGEVAQDESKQQTTSTHMNQHNGPRLDHATVEEHTEGGAKQKRETAGFSGTDAHQKGCNSAL